jgi:CCR4-NOT transcription complex subunit 10
MKAIMNHIDHLENGMIEKAGLLTAILLLDTNQAKKADLLLQMLQARLDLNNDDILAPDDYNLECEQLKKEELDEEQEIFRKLFRLVLIRSNLLNRKNILIPGEETSDFSILKGHQYYLGNDFQMAAKELSKQFKNELITVK